MKRPPRRVSWSYMVEVELQAGRESRQSYIGRLVNDVLVNSPDDEWRSLVEGVRVTRMKSHEIGAIYQLRNTNPHGRRGKNVNS